MKLIKTITLFGVGLLAQKLMKRQSHAAGRVVERGPGSAAGTPAQVHETSPPAVVPAPKPAL